MDKDQIITGIEKAAIIIHSMDDKNSKQIMSMLSKKESEMINKILGQVTNMNKEMKEKIIYDFNVELANIQNMKNQINKGEF